MNVLRVLYLILVSVPRTW